MKFWNNLLALVFAVLSFAMAAVHLALGNLDKVTTFSVVGIFVIHFHNFNPFKDQ